MTPNDTLLYPQISTSLSSQKRNFFHSGWQFFQRPTTDHGAENMIQWSGPADISGMSIPHLLPQGSSITVEEGSRKSLKVGGSRLLQ